MIGIARVIPESQIKTGGRFDFIGAAGLSVVLVCLLFGLSKSTEWGWGDPKQLALFAVSALVFVFWARYELHSKAPLINIQTSIRRVVLFTNLTSILVGFAMYTLNLVMTQLLQAPDGTGLGFGQSMIVAGLCSAPMGVAMMLVSPLAARIISRFGPRFALRLGPLVIAAGFVYAAFFLDYVWEALIVAAVTGIGIAIAYAAMPTIIMRSVPTTETAAANSVNTLSRSLGTSLAAAVHGAIIAAAFADSMAHPEVMHHNSFTAFDLCFVLGAVSCRRCNRNMGLINDGIPFLNDGIPFRGDQHRDLGFTRRQLFDAVLANDLRRLFHGVYVDGGVPDSRELRLCAIKLVTPAYAVMSDCSASWVYGIDTFRPSDRFLMTPALVIPHGSSRVRQRFVQCREAYINPNDVTELDSLLITTPVRTSADLLRRLWRPYALAAADGLTRAELVSTDEVCDYLKRLRGFPRIVQARELAELIDPRAESPGESWTRLRIVDAGFPRPDSQIPITDRDGVEIARIDMGYKASRIAAEYDGTEFHTVADDRVYDEQRRDYLHEVEAGDLQSGTNRRFWDRTWSLSYALVVG